MSKTSFSMDNKDSCQSLVIGFVVADKFERERLVNCPRAKHVAVQFGHSLYLCDLGSGVCRLDGKRVTFRHRNQCFYVYRFCDNGFADLER